MRIPRARRAWTCPECGFTYLSRGDYRAHYQREHLDKPPSSHPAWRNPARRLP